MSTAPNFPWLHLHRRLAAMHYWQERLLWCGLGALALSALAWLLGAHFTWHLVFIFVGAALGFLKPLPSGQNWALHWLDTHVGLSYRTALEVERGEDPYGFYSALHRRVERVGKNFERPSPQPWWLPLFALAFGLLLLPNVPWASLSPLSSQPVLPGAEAPVADDLEDEAEAREEPQDAEETGLPEGLDERSEEGALDASGPERERSFDTPASDRAPESDTPLDREALDNFLRNLSEDEAADEETADPQARPGGDEGAGERETPAQPREAQDGEGQEGEEAAGQERGEQEGQPGQREAEGEEGEGESADGEEAAAGEEEDGEAGEAAGGEDADGEEQGAGPDGAGEQDGLGEEDGDLEPGEGAGAQGMEAQADGLHEELEREEERLEFVPGQREEGASATSGVLRLPGAGEAEGPAGASPESFERSLERAITEGRIPVEYQEVLRDYFR